MYSHRTGERAPALTYEDNIMAETIIKREELKTASFRQHKAWLILTPTRLLFTEDASGAVITGNSAVDVPVAAITNVRAKKPFKAATDVLEVEYTNNEGKPDKCAFQRSSA